MSNLSGVAEIAIGMASLIAYRPRVQHKRLRQVRNNFAHSEITCYPAGWLVLKTKPA